jgi:hypothetical protein
MMAESFFALSPADRKEALAVAASKSGRPAHILEKDAWVVWTLSALFRSAFAQHLIFKGGTSLAYFAHVGPGFHRMPAGISQPCRSRVSRHAGPS